MSKTKHSHHEHEGPNSDSVNHGFHRPYWKHAHHDWRLWVAVSLMLVAMLTYVMTGAFLGLVASHPMAEAGSSGRRREIGERAPDFHEQRVPIRQALSSDQSLTLPTRISFHRRDYAHARHRAWPRYRPTKG